MISKTTGVTHDHLNTWAVHCLDIQQLGSCDLLEISWMLGQTVCKIIQKMKRLIMDIIFKV